jgi:hypothetical protein
MTYRDWLNEGADLDDLRAMRPVKLLDHMDDIPAIVRAASQPRRAAQRSIGRRWHPATNDGWLVRAMQRESHDDDPF